jgi:hypothetical protein
MANTNYHATNVGGVDLYSVDDSQKFTLGTIVQAKDPTLGVVGEFIYLLGVASTVEGSWATFDEVFATALLAANAHAPVGIAMAATVANKYGWYQISGKAVGKVAAAFADNGLCYATATAGTADDAVVVGDRVKGALGRSAIDTPATGFAYIQLFYPYMDDAAAA